MSRGLDGRVTRYTNGIIFEAARMREKMNFILVNNECLNAKFPTVALTQLQINPTDATGNIPANQCLPCIKASPQKGFEVDTDLIALSANHIDHHSQHSQS